MTCVEKTVWCKTSFIGFHCWPEAPREVLHLRSPHRHQFNVEVHVLVDHSDRAVEFQMLKSTVDHLLASNGMFVCIRNPGRIADTMTAYSYSCEMMAEELAKALAVRGHTVHKVTVDEDGENGATLYFCEEPTTK